MECQPQNGRNYKCFTAHALRSGAPEAKCDGVDDDCEGTDFCPVDVDGDGFSPRLDCGDNDPGRNPNKPEIWCNGIDEDCDGMDDCDHVGDRIPESQDCNDYDCGLDSPTGLKFHPPASRSQAGDDRNGWRNMQRVVRIFLATSLTLAWAASALAATPVIYRFDASLSGANVVNLSWETQGGDPTRPVYIFRWTDRPGDLDVGERPRDCIQGPSDACSTSLRVSPGTHRFTLKLTSTNGEVTTRETEITVPELAPPIADAGKRISLDMFRVPESTDTERTISWTRPGGAPGGYVRVYRPGSWFPEGPRYYPTDSYVAQVSDLKFGPSEQHPRASLTEFRLEYCEDQPPDSALGETTAVTFCSGTIPITFVAEPSKLTTPTENRIWVPANQAFDLAWTGTTGNGNFWVVDSSTLNTWQWTAENSYQIPAESMVPGFHDLTLVSAVWGGPWSNHADLLSTATGFAHCLAAYNEGVFGGYSRMLRITSDQTSPDCSTPAVAPDVDLLAPDTGYAQVTVAENDAITVNEMVGFVVTPYPPHVDHRQIIVGDPSPAWQIKPVSSDFADYRIYKTYTLPTAGAPLDVYLAPDGQVWGTSEFGSALIHGLPDGTLTRHEAPLFLKWNATTHLFDRTMPYSSFGNPSTRGGGERVRPGGGYIWVPQGGDLDTFGGNPQGNYSRIMRFDPQATDSSTTEWDDRMCMYSLPPPNPSDPLHASNNTVSAAWDSYRHRLWFTESNPAHPALSWLDPNYLPCTNFVDYDLSDPSKILAQTNRYCGNNDTDTSPCIHKIDLKAQSVEDALHLVVDSDAVWFNEWLGQTVDRYDIATGVVRRFPPPKMSAIPAPFTVFFGSSLAQINIDEHYVYFNEFVDSDIVRLDKSMLAQPGLCDTLDPQGNNPCMQEIHLPTYDTSDNLVMAWMDIDPVRGRAWFSFGQSAKHGPDGTIGYVDIANWQPGVRYTGMGDLVESERHGYGPANFGGISVDPASGKVAVTDYFREQIVLLCPSGC